MSNNTEWYLTSEQMPGISNNPEWSETVQVVVIKGNEEQWVDIAQYHFPTEQWHGGGTFPYNLTPWIWVTHWSPIPLFPARIPYEVIVDQAKQLEPDFVDEQSSMRALFEDVDPADKSLQEKCLISIRRTGMQGTRISTSGVAKGDRYYVDFWASDPIHLRQIKKVLDQLDAAYTILPKKK